MPAILTPALALRHLRALSTDVRAAVALGADGGCVAGDAALAGPAHALLARLAPDAGHALSTPRGAVLVARAPSLAAVVVAGPHALLPLLAHDLDTLLADTQEDGAAAVRGAAPAARDAGHAPPSAAVTRHVDALIDAAAGDLGVGAAARAAQ